MTDPNKQVSTYRSTAEGDCYNHLPETLREPIDLAEQSDARAGVVSKTIGEILGKLETAQADD